MNHLISTLQNVEKRVLSDANSPHQGSKNTCATLRAWRPWPHTVKLLHVHSWAAKNVNSCIEPTKFIQRDIHQNIEFGINLFLVNQPWPISMGCTREMGTSQADMLAKHNANTIWQPEMTENAEICKKIALLWTGLPFNTGFMAPLKSHPLLLKRKFCHIVSPS